MAEQERIIELVFRFKTNGYQGELDDLMAYGQQIQEDMNHTGAGDEELRAHDGSDLRVEYIPEGSHWRDVTPQLSMGTTDAYLHGLPWNPEAAALPGGNELSPPQEDQ